MGGITDDEKSALVAVVARRLGRRASAAELVDAYLHATARWSMERTLQGGPVPTSLGVERAALLLELSKQLKRVVEDFEIQALLRVTASQAKAMRTTLVATYSDVTDELTLDWSLRGAALRDRVQGEDVVGPVVRFVSKERRDAFISQMERQGIKSERVLGEEDAPWQVIVSDSFPKSQLPSSREK